ncbi:MAG TPA: DUF3105 domain-containing protein [Anaerolineales bacterium]|nr:DUF3105 domain-containing protein [Anaerolineales bacterium]
MKTKRQASREKRKQQQLRTRLIWGVVGLALAAIIGYALWVAFRPTAGQSVPIMADTGHIPDDAVPGPYNSDPPTSGPHYAEDLPAGIYQEADLAGLPEHPEGLLVHSLEHGYVIFWYNCDLLDEGGCSELKEQIQGVMDQSDNFKVIAFPWKSTDAPLVMTSWGKLQRFESFNPAQAQQFVERNRNHAPEPNAP